MLKNRVITRGFYGMQMMGGMGPASNAGLCRQCGKCISACPQKIAIPDELKKVSKTLETWQTKVIFMIAKRIFRTPVQDE